VSSTTPAGRPGRLKQAFSVLLLAILSGFLVGFTEGTIIWVRQLFGAVTFASEHVVWMSAVSYALVFAVVGIGLGLLALAWPGIFDRRLTLAVCVAFGVFCLLLPLGWLSRYAIILLAAGVGVRTWFVWKRRHAGWTGYGRRLAAFALIATVLMTGVPQVAASLRVPSTDAPDDAVNVVIVIWDTVRASGLSLHGYEQRTTPALSEIARSATVFDRAIATSPWTLPSHASIFTGRYPHEVSADWFDALDREHPTLAEWFRDRGWRTGAFVANHHYTSHDSGLDRGFETYEDYFVSFNQTLLTSHLIQTGTAFGVLQGIRTRSPSRIMAAIRELDLYPLEKRTSQRKHAETVNAQFTDWVDGLDGRPFFAFLNYFDAHRGYWAPPEVRARFDRASPGGRDDYDAAIAYLDMETRALFDALDTRGLLDNTLIIVTSDHGELFGEHGRSGHASNVYHDVLRVPLLMRYPPALPVGARVPDPASLSDLATTVTTIVAGDSSSFPGRPLTRLFRPWTPEADEWALAEVRPGRAHPPETPLSRGALTAVADTRYHYILNGDGIEELFDYRSAVGDPVDLVANPTDKTPQTLRRMRERVRKLLGATPSDHSGWQARDSLISAR
jgi:arylsulfatase A-like enzyme